MRMEKKVYRDQDGILGRAASSISNSVDEILVGHEELTYRRRCLPWIRHTRQKYATKT